MLTVPPTTKLWFAGGVDLRLGFDGLANLVRGRLNADPTGGHLFAFTNRAANRVKVPYWGGRGLNLWCQRLEVGRYPFPAVSDGRLELTATQFATILVGLDPATARPRSRSRR